MTDPIQAAIERAEEACDLAIADAMVNTGAEPSFSVAAHSRDAAFATINSLAEVVRKYGHVAGCECHTSVGSYEPRDCRELDHRHPYRDPRCLPESREEKS